MVQLLPLPVLNASACLAMTFSSMGAVDSACGNAKISMPRQLFKEPSYSTMGQISAWQQREMHLDLPEHQSTALPALQSSAHGCQQAAAAYRKSSSNKAASCAGSRASSRSAVASLSSGGLASVSAPGMGVDSAGLPSVKMSKSCNDLVAASKSAGTSSKSTSTSRKRSANSTSAPGHSRMTSPSSKSSKATAPVTASSRLTGSKSTPDLQVLGVPGTSSCGVVLRRAHTSARPTGTIQLAGLEESQLSVSAVAMLAPALPVPKPLVKRSGVPCKHGQESRSTSSSTAGIAHHSSNGSTEGIGRLLSSTACAAAARSFPGIGLTADKKQSGMSACDTPAGARMSHGSCGGVAVLECLWGTYCNEGDAAFVDGMQMLV